MRRKHRDLAIILFATVTGSAQYSKKTVVAHRGASAYAPEHTLAAYRLAIEMGADYVEQDLAVTKDGVLICLHDASLERTTNVEELFPGSLGEHQHRREDPIKAWVANDFTLAEIKRLDAGSWFDKKFAGEKVPTFDEAIALIRGKAGIFPGAEDAGDLRRPRREVRGDGRRRARQARPARPEGRSEDAGDPADIRPGERAQARADQDRRAGRAAARTMTKGSRRPRR